MTAAAGQAILIVGPSWVGDMVMAQGLFQVLARRQPAAAIDVMAPAWARPILARMPEVRRAIDMPLGHGKLGLGERYRLGKSLRTEGYQQAILLPNSLKSALVPLFARIAQRTGWRGEMRYGLLNDIRLLNKERYPLMVQRFVALAFEPFAQLPSPAPAPALQFDQEIRRKLFKQWGLEEDVPLLALCPGAEFGPAKRWPESHYASVAETYLAREWQIAIFGSANDVAVAETIVSQISQESERCHILAGNTTLIEAVDLLSGAAAVVSNDSGLMHIAAALERPLCVVYGSTSPDFTPPLSEKVAIERLSVDCGPCFKRECPLPAQQSPMKCLQDLPPKRIVAALIHRLF